MEEIIALYRTVFIEGLPITKNEIKYLDDFFFKGEFLPEIHQILSKISIQQSDNNKEFIRGFLEDRNGNYNAIPLLTNIQVSINSYPLVVDIDLAE